MLNAGLTGGIASGKSTVARMFQEKGAHLIDFDALGHFVEQPGQLAWQEIVEVFGREILNGDGTINRAKLGAIVFKDKENLARLNSIVHPAVFREGRRRISLIKAENPEAIILSDIPLLIEVKAQNFVELDLIILVYITPDEQVRRLMRRNGYRRDEALMRLACQMSIDEKIRYADIVIDNQSSPEKTREIVEQVWVDLLKREKQRRLHDSL